jgi:hypothetical protein
MTEPRAPYTTADPTRPTEEIRRQAILRRLTTMLTWDQLEQVAASCEEIVQRSGVGEVRVIFRDCHPRFVRMQLSLDAARPGRLE